MNGPPFHYVLPCCQPLLQYLPSTFNSLNWSNYGQIHQFSPLKAVSNSGERFTEHAHILT